MDSTLVYVVAKPDDTILGIFSTEEYALKSISYSCHKIGLPKVTLQPDNSWIVECPDGSKITIKQNWLHHGMTHI